MQISDEAVEAAYGQVLSDDTLRYVTKASLRSLLEAAGPYIAAQAWDEGEHVGYQNCGFDDLGLPATSNPYRR